MPDKFHSDSGERVEYTFYSPGLINSGNRITTTWTITQTSEGGGMDWWHIAPLTLPAPADKRFDILRIGTRSSLTVDSFNGGCTQLRCRIYVDAQHANNLLHDITITGAGNTLTVQDLHSAAKATIYNLLKDGLAHNFIFYFWVNAGSAVLSVAQLWEGVGTASAQSSPIIKCLSFAHTGLMEMDVRWAGLSAGSMSGSFARGYTTEVVATGTLAGAAEYAFCNSGLRLTESGQPLGASCRLTTTTGLAYVLHAFVVARSR